MSRTRSTTSSTAGSLAGSTGSKSPAVSFIDSKIPGGFPCPDIDGTSPTTSTQLSLASRVHERRSEFTRQHDVRIRVGSWNVAAFKGTELDLAGWFVRGKGVSEALSGLSVSGDHHGKHTEGFDQQEARWSKYRSTIPKHDPGSLPANGDVGIYALGLQEVVDISSAAEALRPYTDPAPANKYKEAVQSALPPGYQLVAERQLIGLLLLIWASPTVAPQISWVSTTSVGTGLMGYMGNKGAVTARIVLGGTTRLVFVNSHLSAGTGKAEAERRNWDAEQVEARTRFDPITDDAGIQHSGEKIGDEDFAFWFGDLNYRLEGIPPEDVRRLLMLHTQNEYDHGSKSDARIEHEIGGTPKSTLPAISTAASNHQKSHHSSHDQEYHMSHHEDPASLQTTIDSLLSHDELIQQMHNERMFHDGWREGPITFLPTYKYDRGTVGVFDTGEKKRGPSWCDRILYRTREDLQLYNDTLEAEQDSRQKDEELKAQGINPSLHEDQTLFEYDPDADGDDSFEEQPEALPGGGKVKHVITKEGNEDTIKLEYYITHQRVLSSDHKPIDAGFLLKYDAVVPELKAKVQQEVARLLDKAENEGRPIITLVVDKAHHDADVNGAFDGADFGRLRYDEPKLRTITVANTGPIPAQFGFAIRPQDAPSATPPWLHVRFDKHAERITKDHKQASKDAQEWYDSVPHVFSLAPGESCNVNLIAEIADKELVHSLNSNEHIEDVLVLRVKDGRDQFLALRADWQKSSHGHTLDRLLRVPEGGVRKLQNQHPEGKWRHRFGLKSRSVDHGGQTRSLSGSSDVGIESEGSNRASFEVEDEEEVRWSAPREIFRLTEEIEALIERACAEWSMTAAPAPNTTTPSITSAVFNSNPLAQPGYPFNPSTWTLRDADARRAYRVEINEALDTNSPFSALLLPADDAPLPLSHRLQLFAETLVLFLSNMHGGIITPALWSALETNFFFDKSSSSSARAKMSAEDQKTRVLEILEEEGEGAKCKTCFSMLMMSLGRMCGELATATVEVGSGVPQAQSQSHGPMAAMGSLLRRMNSYEGSAANAAAPPRDAGVARERIVKRWAEVFAPAVVHGNVVDKGKRSGEEERKRDLIELFLTA